MFDWGPFGLGFRRTIGNVTVSVRRQVSKFTKVITYEEHASEILLPLLRSFTRVRNAYLLRDLRE